MAINHPPAPCKPGDRIRLVKMGSDPDPIPPGTTGTVERLHAWPDGTWQISVEWDVPRTLSLVWPEDSFVVL